MSKKHYPCTGRVGLPRCPAGVRRVERDGLPRCPEHPDPRVELPRCPDETWRSERRRLGLMGRKDESRVELHRCPADFIVSTVSSCPVAPPRMVALWGGGFAVVKCNFCQT
eukprot:gene14171-biopygen8271